MSQFGPGSDFLPHPDGSDDRAVAAVESPRPGIVPVENGAPPSHSEEGDPDGETPGIPGRMWSGDRSRDALGAKPVHNAPFEIDEAPTDQDAPGAPTAGEPRANGELNSNGDDDAGFDENEMRRTFDELEAERGSNESPRSFSAADAWRLVHLRRQYIWNVLGMGGEFDALYPTRVWHILFTHFCHIISLPSNKSSFELMVATIMDASETPPLARDVFDELWNRLKREEVEVEKLLPPPPAPVVLPPRTAPGAERPQIALPSLQQVQGLDRQLQRALRLFVNVRIFVIALFAFVMIGGGAAWRHQTIVDAKQSEEIAGLAGSQEWMNDHVADLISVFSKETDKERELRTAAEAAASEAATSARTAEQKFGRADERATSAERRAGYAQRALEAMLTTRVLQSECTPGALNVKGRERRVLYDRFYCGSMPTLCTKNPQGAIQSCYAEELK